MVAYSLCQGGYVSAFANLSVFQQDKSEEVVTNLDEIFWRGRMCDEQQLIRIWS